MAGTPVTPFDLVTITSVPETDSLMVFRDGGENDVTVRNFLESARVIADANLTSVRLATLDENAILNVSQLPAGYDDSAPLGTWAIDNTSPVLSDSGGSTGNKYRIVASGTISEGAGTLAVDGETVKAGDMIVKGASAWYIAPKVANQFDGTTDEDTASDQGDYYRKGAVNDRTNAKQPLLNGVDFNGASSLLTITDNAAIQFGTNDFSITGTIKHDQTPASNDQVFQNRHTGSTGIRLYFTSANRLVFTVNDGSNTDTITSASTYAISGEIYRWAVTADRDGDVTLYVNGEVASSATMTATGNVNSGNNLVLGSRNGAEFFQGQMYDFFPWNRLLSAAEVQAHHKTGQVEAADQAATNATQTSGTLTVGNRYRIDTFVSGDDFTNVGAASNATGVEFVATGTTPTTYSNGSTLRSIGAVVQLFSENIESDGSIRDASSNGLHATGTNTEPLRKSQLTDVDARSPASGSALAQWANNGTVQVKFFEDGKVNFANLPTSSGGLSSGDLWNDSGTLKIV